MQNISKSIHIWILLVLLGVSSVWAQTAPTVQWERIFDRDSQFGTSAFINVPTSDEGALVAIFGNNIKNISPTTSNGDAIVKLNARNEVIWAKMTNDLMGIPVGPNSEFLPAYRISSMIASATGGYFVAGYMTSSGSGENFIMKISDNSTPEWIQKFPFSREGQDSIKTITATKDGGLIVGRDYSERLFDGVYLRRYNTQGTVLSTATLSFQIGNLLFAKIEKVRTDGDDLLAIGSYNETPTKRRGFVAKLRADLTTIWLKRDTEEFVDVIRDPKSDRYLALKAGGFTSGSLNNPISAFSLDGQPINILYQ